MKKVQEKIKAIQLRKEGFSYGEILKQVLVSKSTLSLWLRSVGLSKRQKQRLTAKKLASIRRGWEKWHQIRVEKTNKIKAEAIGEMSGLDKNALWLICVALYWAEGSKEKEHNPGQNVQLGNSDPRMIKIFLKWLREVVKTNKEDIKYDIYIHENSKNRIEDVIKFWSSTTNASVDDFKYVYFKKNKIKTKRKNVGDNYWGVLRVTVRKSSSLNRRISGWVEGICKNYQTI